MDIDGSAIYSAEGFIPPALDCFRLSGRRPKETDSGLHVVLKLVSTRSLCKHAAFDFGTVGVEQFRVELGVMIV